MGRIAQLYFIEKETQSAISRRLNISQATISRLLKRAQEEDIVRITINTPRGTFPDLEDELRRRFGLDDAIVAEAGEETEDSILTAIGAATAHFIENSLREKEVIGLSSWSATLLRVVDALHSPRIPAARVIQLLGGTGSPGAEKHATHLTLRMAQITEAVPQLLAAPGLTQTAEARAILIQDPFVRDTLDQFADITLALVGIGALEPSQMLADSGNRLSAAELRELGDMGAVGDMGLRFFDREGHQVRSSCDQRIIGIDLPELAAIPRVVAVAGGPRKVDAIRAAMLGGFLSVLVTDNHTAARLAAP